MGGTDEYRTDSDVLGGFLKECCDETKSSRVAKIILYRVYRGWVETNGEYEFSSNMLSRKMKERGIKSVTDGKVRYWEGLELNREGSQFDRITQDS